MSEEHIKPAVSFLTTGRGVPRQIAAPEEEPKKPSGVDAAGKRMGITLSDKPDTIDQAEKYPTSVKVQAPQLAVYDLGVPDQLAALNELLEGGYPPSAPTVMIHEMESKFSESNNNWKALVRYSRIKYVKLLPET